MAQTRDRESVLSEEPIALTTDDTDPVMGALRRAEAEYLAARSQWDQQAMALKEARQQVERLEQLHDRLASDLKQQQARLDEERRRAERHRQRANQLAAALKTIHRALFGGNVYQMILQACLTITGGTRGLYLTAQGDRLRVRAAVGVDGYPQQPPSGFLLALCRKVIADNKTLICHREGDLPAAPPPDRPSEHFHNCVVAPVALLKNFDGILIVADKPHGDFDEEDAEQIVSVGDQAAVAIQNQLLQRELQETYLAVVSVLADALEAHDPYTHGHCQQVARLAHRTAERLALDDLGRGIACYGGLLHDVGKIGVSDGVLNKPGKLLPEEWDLMRSHVRVGRDLLERIPTLSHVSDVVLYHHERWDGHGYPDGLKGEQIPLPARIVGVVDAYCAMTTKRSYKEAATPAEARAELVRQSGTQFDPRVVQAFLEVLDTPDADGGEVLDGDALDFDICDFSHILQASRRARAQA